MLGQPCLRTRPASATRRCPCCLGALADLPSSPTRRSSDLGDAGGSLVAARVIIGITVGRPPPGQLPQPAHLAVPGRDREVGQVGGGQDRKSTRLNSSHLVISYAVFCLKKNNHCQCSDSPVCVHAPPRPPAAALAASAPSPISPLPLHDALPIWVMRAAASSRHG